MMSDSPFPDARAAHDENNIAFLRLALALAVVWTHSFNVLGLADPFEVWLGAGAGTPSVQLVNMGVLAVDGFFVLSGYLISGSWARRRSWRGFLGNRARRLYPGWFVVIAICLFIVSPLGSKNPGAVWHEIAAHPTRLLSLLWMTPPQFPLTLERVPLPRAVNSSLWTLAYEFRLYLLVPLVGTIWLWLCQRFSRRRVWWLPACVFALLYVFYGAQLTGFGLQTSLGLGAPHDPRYPVVPTHWPRLATFFTAGACLYVYRAHFRASPGLTIGCLAALIMARCLGVLPWALPIFGSAFRHW